MDEKDLKKTLNLPQTRFPMKANLVQREPEFLKKWEQANLYHKLREVKKGKPVFLLHDGPPYANGKIHLGHVINKVLKDLVLKSKSMMGFDCPYVPGWDCHGLPIELQVEKNAGARRRTWISSASARSVANTPTSTWTSSGRGSNAWGFSVSGRIPT